MNDEEDRFLVPKGAMIPFLGDVIPSAMFGRWVFADGVAEWPEESCVPEKLRGNAYRTWTKACWSEVPTLPIQSRPWRLLAVCDDGMITVTLDNAPVTLHAKTAVDKKHTTPPKKETAAHGSLGGFA